MAVVKDGRQIVCIVAVAAFAEAGGDGGCLRGGGDPPLAADRTVPSSGPWVTLDTELPTGN
jgi:hypothetical protein